MNLISEIKKNKSLYTFLLVMFLIALSSCLYFYVKARNENKDVIKGFEDERKERLILSETILSDAVQKNSVRKIRKIFKENEDLIKNSYREISYGENEYYSILHYAINIQNYEAAEEILKAGYNPDVKDKDGNTPLLYTVSTDTLFMNVARKLYLKDFDEEIKFIKLLLDYGASVNACDDENRNLLILASQQSWILTGENFSIPEYLIKEAHIDINHLDSNNHTAAYYALSQKGIRFAHFLIVKNHADVTIGFDETYTPAVLLSNMDFDKNYNYEDIKKELPENIDDETKKTATLLLEKASDIASSFKKLKEEIIAEFKNQGITDLEL